MLHYANPILRAKLVSPVTGVFGITVPLAGTIKEIAVYSDLTVSTDDAVFDCNLNGTTMFADQATRPKIIVGAKTGVRTNLAIAVSRGDKIIVDLDAVHSSGVGQDLSIVFQIDDGGATLSVNAFITDFYQGTFARNPTTSELNSTRSSLQTGCAVGGASFRDAAAGLGDDLFTDGEYTARARTDAQYVADLYLAYLGRVGDVDGVSYWTAQVVAQSRTIVRAAFARSLEFLNYRCAFVCPNTLPASDAVQLQGRPFDFTEPQDGQTIVWSDSTGQWEPQDQAGGGTFHGDVTGSSSASTVEKIQNRAVANYPPTTGITDNFSTFDLGMWTKDVGTGVTVSSVGNKARIAFSSGFGSGPFGFHSNDAFDMAGESVQIFMGDTTLGNVTTAACRLVLFKDSNNWVRFTSAAFTYDLTLQIRIGGSTTTVATINTGVGGVYQNAYWKLAHNAVTQEWEFYTSLDASTWTLRGSTDATFWDPFGLTIKIEVTGSNNSVDFDVDNFASSAGPVDSILDLQVMTWSGVRRQWEAVTQSWIGMPVAYGVALGDLTTAITTGTSKAYFRVPHAMTLLDVRASLLGASSSGAVTIDVNEGGASILSTKLSIDSGETTSETAATPAVISDADLADDAVLTFDIDGAGTGATGPLVWIIGVRV